MRITTPMASMTKVSGTTAYDANDIIGSSATAGSLLPLKWDLRPVGAHGIIRRVRVWKAATTTTAASFTLHLFSALPVPSNGDNGAYLVADITAYLGNVACDMSSGATVGTASLFKAFSGGDIRFAQPALNLPLYGLLQAIGTYTPVTLEEFRFTLEIEGD